MPRTAEGDKIIAEVMDAFLSGLGKGDVETNVFDSNVRALIWHSTAAWNRTKDSEVDRNGADLKG